MSHIFCALFASHNEKHEKTFESIFEFYIYHLRRYMTKFDVFNAKNKNTDLHNRLADSLFTIEAKTKN
jgi:hypothetical protein